MDKIIKNLDSEIQLWSGKCILSYIIPKNIHLKMHPLILNSEVH